MSVGGGAGFPAPWPGDARLSIWSRLTQKTSAAWLLGALVAVPAIPTVIASLLPPPAWDTVAEERRETLVNDLGGVLSFTPPAGWQMRRSSSRASYRSGERAIFVEIIARNARDPAVVAERSLRRDAFAGVHASFDGGTLAAPALDLTGPTCTIVADGRVGRCAVLSNDTLIVRIQSVGSADEPALPLEPLVASIGGITS